MSAKNTLETRRVSRQGEAESRVQLPVKFLSDFIIADLVIFSNKSAMKHR
jgi:hypothetical protein